MSSRIKKESFVDRARKPLAPSRTSRLTPRQELIEGYDDDQWHGEERGEEYRYNRKQAYFKAKQAYQQAAALAYQKATHKPFYMEDIGLSPEEQNMPEQETKPQVARQYMRPTHFYPDGGNNDTVSRVQGVGRVQMQKIYPNYEYSTAETRESGLGPSLETIQAPPRRKIDQNS